MSGDRNKDQNKDQGKNQSQEIRIIEAVLFAASEPLDEASLAAHLPEGADVAALLEQVRGLYAGRGIVLSQRGGRWLFHTAEDLSAVLERHKQTPRRLSRAALETLATIAYHQPITRAEIEDVRGVSLSSGTLDRLLEIGWVKILGKRDVLGHPVIYGTSDEFLQHFGLNTIDDLPNLEELRATGLMEKTPPMLNQTLNQTLNQAPDAQEDDPPSDSNVEQAV